MKKLGNLINLFFIRLSEEKNKTKRKIIYYVAMGLSIISVILSLFTPLCLLEINGVTHKLTAFNWFYIDNISRLGSFHTIQIISFVVLVATLVITSLFVISTFTNKDEETKIMKKSDTVSTICFAVVFLYMIFTWFFPIVSYSEGEHQQHINTNYFLVAYAVFVKVIYSIFLEMLKKFRKAEVQEVDKNIKVTIEKKVKEPRRKRRKDKENNNNNNQFGFNQKIEIDGCPLFTELDEKKPIFDKQLKDRKPFMFENPTLPKIVDFIVHYARDSRLHLYYTHEEIATFIAGLGTTNLAILQGMSGTGKTSLPKIVAEAIHSNCDIVEVESSWRDKNELLGYYNEFSKIYTPKKFTQALYKAKLNSEVLTFIVLDEMNLSRIEYYFSDFLSLMENEPDKREIRLVNVKLKKINTEAGYYGLQEGHTLKIPNNVWFIGTANRDESTYDISDKVYDRANTMNFDKRAKKAKYFSEPLNPKYVPVKVLLELFEKAKSSVEFTIDENPIIEEVERILEPYNISFGNRIALQIETFVKIYSSCFELVEEAKNDALEIILLSKIVRKLELKNIEDKEELAAKFASLNLMRCSNFIQNLKED